MNFHAATMKQMCILGATLFVFLVSSCEADILTPRDFAEKVIEKVLDTEKTIPGVFLNWKYGGGIIFDAIHRASKVLKLNYTQSILNRYLDKFEHDPSSFGYKILHGEHIPFDSAVGDDIGLFPIAYLNRIVDHSGDSRYSNTSDVKIVNTVAQKFIVGYPYRLPDGTFSRHKGWGKEVDRNASFVWGDDQYMGLILLARLARTSNNPTYAEFIGKMAVQFAKYMKDPVDGLFYHGYNDADKKVSCCKWGRANGWGMMSHVEVLEALDHFPDLRKSFIFEEVLRVFQSHASAVARVQSKDDGRWHQVLNETSTYLETSATAMFTSSIIRGIQHSWLDREKFDGLLSNAWRGLQKTIEDDGTVSGICVGTGIQLAVSDYQQRPTDFSECQPGLGSVIHAMLDFYNYLGGPGHH